MEKVQIVPNNEKHIFDEETLKQVQENNFPKISGVPEIKFFPLGPKDYKRRKMKIEHIKEMERKERNTAVAFAIATVLSLISFGSIAEEAQTNFLHNQNVKKAMEPVRNEVHRILSEEQFDIYDQEKYQQYNKLIPVGFSYKHDDISEIMNQKFEESLLEGQIYLGELNEQIMYKENGNMDRIIRNMNVEYTHGSKTMQEYVESLDFTSIEDYYKAMKEAQYTLSQGLDNTSKEEQDGPKL